MDGNLNSYWAEIIVEEIVRCGVDHFCVAPGSRSTPLVVAAARNKKVKSVVCYDERSAGFYALGYAKATNKAMAVITTSGTAVANLLPAVTEASMDKIPMLVVTADRPEELKDTGANQTIKQDGIFGEFVRWQHDFPCPTGQIKPEVILTAVDQAVYRTTAGDSGPVHINCRFREPLEPVEAAVCDGYAKNIERWLSCDRPFTSYHSPDVRLSGGAIERLAGVIESADRGMIVVGRLKSDLERQSVLRLTKKLQWPVYFDVTSGLRLSAKSTNVIRYFDQQVLSEEFNSAVRPSVVLHFGGRTTSKRLDQFLDANRPDDYVVIDDCPDRYDRCHAVTERLQAGIAHAADAIGENVKTQTAGEYADRIGQVAAEAQGVIETAINGEDSLSEAFVARHISQAVPEGTLLFLSNSMPIRDMDLYGVSGRREIVSYANRGVSGIDGIISTAAGLSAASGKLTTLMIGDLACLYDLNALSILSLQALPVIAIVINNQGGGIFDFLPISEHKDVFEKFFVAGHNFKFDGVCKTFNIDHYTATSKDDLCQAYADAVVKLRPAVIEVSSDRADNLRLRRRMKREIIETMEQIIK